MRTTFARPRLVLPAVLSFPILSMLLLNGCGGGSSSSSTTSGGGGGTTTTAKTTVAIQISSKANDQLSQYTLTIQSITLTNSSGSTTIPISYPNASSNGVNLDFTAANGGTYPVATVQVPQGTYTSASVNIAAPTAMYLYDSGSNVSRNALAETNPPTTANVSLPSPITIASTPIGLNVSVDVSSSLTLSNAQSSGATFTGTPAITLTAFNINQESTTPANGKCIGLYGQITAASSSSMTATLAANGALIQQNAGYQPGVPVTAALNSSTVYQGSAKSASDLKTGEFANFDLVLETDGSYTVSRVEIDDSTATDMTAGMVVNASPTVSTFHDNPTIYEGKDLTGSTGSTNYNVLGFTANSSTKFQISSTLANASSLPFTPTFNASTLFPGQNVAIGATSYSNTSAFSTPTSVTLVPQTIDAQVTGAVTNGNFRVYTVTLASYDPIVQVNSSALAGNGLLLLSTTNIQVYVSSSLSNLPTINTNSTYRFHGLLFNNNGTIAMVADQVTDGVAF